MQLTLCPMMFSFFCHLKGRNPEPVGLRECGSEMLRTFSKVEPPLSDTSFGCLLSAVRILVLLPVVSFILFRFFWKK